ncbi:hypothetical protein C8Q74DRAFT_187355 [Fomes fomentarius]|nr:hypothetical protein C8Q74DRAFT_187355 [Fomes fomentarius]
MMLGHHGIRCLPGPSRCDLRYIINWLAVLSGAVHWSCARRNCACYVHAYGSVPRRSAVDPTENGDHGLSSGTDRYNACVCVLVQGPVIVDYNASANARSEYQRDGVWAAENFTVDCLTPDEELTKRAAKSPDRGQIDRMSQWVRLMLLCLNSGRSITSQPTSNIVHTYTNNVKDYYPYYVLFSLCRARARHRIHARSGATPSPNRTTAHTICNDPSLPPLVPPG